MASLAQTSSYDAEVKPAGAEAELCDAFFELLDMLPSDAQKGLLSDLRANAEAHGE